MKYYGYSPYGEEVHRLKVYSNLQTAQNRLAEEVKNYSRTSSLNDLENWYIIEVEIEE